MFKVDTAALTEMDFLERVHEEDDYRRVEIDVLCQSSSVVFKVFVYGKPEAQYTGHQFELTVRQVLTGEYLLSMQGFIPTAFNLA